MAVTQGHGNPDWTRDEIILALDLYFERDGMVPGPKDPDIIALSEVIRGLPIHDESAKRDSFRNPAGVAFKLQNLRQVATGKGLEHSSVADKSAWAEFGQHPEKARLLARLIREQCGDAGVTHQQAAVVDADEEFSEGRVLTALHISRERNPKVRTKLVRARQDKGPLTCDACLEGSKAADPDFGVAGFEAHHLLPLGHSGPRTTKLADVALVCATCHRLLHRAIKAKGTWISIPEFRSLLRPKAEG